MGHVFCYAVVLISIVLGISAIWVTLDEDMCKDSLCMDSALPAMCKDSLSRDADGQLVYGQPNVSGSGTRCSLPVEVYLCYDADIALEGFIGNGACTDLASNPIYATKTCSEQSSDMWTCFYYQAASIVVTTECPRESPSHVGAHECYINDRDPPLVPTILLAVLLSVVFIKVWLGCYDRTHGLISFMSTQLFAACAF